MVNIYGIPNCDTVKRALKWLKDNKVDYHFINLKEGITSKELNSWVNKAGLEIVLNKKSTTWRQLDPEVQQKMKNKQAAIKLMQIQTSLIKRPVLEFQNNLIFGFSRDEYNKLLNESSKK